MKRTIAILLCALLTFSLFSSVLTVPVSADSYINQSAAGKRVVWEGVPEHWQSKNGYVGFYTKHIMV